MINMEMINPHQRIVVDDGGDNSGQRNGGCGGVQIP